MKRGMFIFVFIVALIVIGFFLKIKPLNTREYGVFLGINGSDMERLRPYKTVVIDPSEFTSEQIAHLHEWGKTVVGYFNVGSLEKHREYYKRFQSKALGEYENWPDEYWMDVSDPTWQQMLKERSEEHVKMGVDGFFVDNVDVYHMYPKEEIYRGLCSVLQDLKMLEVPIIINGGDVFVSRCMAENIALDLFDGVNQESVFTQIDFQNNKYLKQEEMDKAYFLSYLLRVKEYSLSVWLLEYAPDESLKKEIDQYAKANGFLWYGANSWELK